MVPRSTDNGLWTALAAQIHDSSAAGSRLVGPLRPGQPISNPTAVAGEPDVVVSGVVVDMFGYRRARHAADPLSAA